MKHTVHIPVLLNPLSSVRCEWCDEHIGQENILWEVNPMNISTREGFSTFVFKNKSDAIMFALRWAGIEV